MTVSLVVSGSLKSSSHTIKLTIIDFLFISSQQYSFLPVYICKRYSLMFQHIQDHCVQYYVLLKLNIFYYCWVYCNCSSKLRKINLYLLWRTYLLKNSALYNTKCSAVSHYCLVIIKGGLKQESVEVIHVYKTSLCEFRVRESFFIYQSCSIFPVL
jgi:hypothetical protein